MRTHGFPLILAIVPFVTGTLMACAGDTGAVTPPVVPPFLRTVNVVLPISGTCQTAFDPPTLPPPPQFQQVDRGVCTLSHLGRTTIYSLEEIDIIAGTQRSIEFTYTAANGDVLRAANVGTNVPNGPGVRFSAVTTFVGGTGRFANATGQARIEGTASFLTNTATYTVDGWIAYDAATSK
jgi:hypothetical protein